MIPTITTTAPVTIQYAGNTISLAAGTHKNPALRFKEGSNILKVTGNATVTISYREGSL